MIRRQARTSLTIARLGRTILIASAWLCLSMQASWAVDGINLLFLGDRGHHNPAQRFDQLQPILKARGIEWTYTEAVTDLNPKTLAPYDGLVIYANTERIAPEQEQALIDFVEGGKGLAALHCASYCFLNSEKYAALVGARFKSHGADTFRTIIAAPEHAAMRGFGGFESWDETYVHEKHNEQNRTVLEYREENGRREPWTWVRTQGKGRVFYTAWGHDQRTWGHAGFQNLVERGIRWAVGSDPSLAPAFGEQVAMTPLRTDVQPFTYAPALVPNYVPKANWGKMGEPIKQMQQPLEPAESMKHFVTPVGFEVKLFASEPQIGKPLCMAWDERGRLWIAETVDYPNELQPPGKGRDRIRILEDTDGDGLADKFTIFAEGLSIPTSLIIAGGGVIVHQAPDTLLLKDTDGDDKADQRRVLFTGWSTSDTHAGPSNLQYGPDNWIWGIVGYAGFQGEIGGEQQSFRTGFYRFKPDGSKFEFVRNTNNNTWGLGFSEEGLLFGSTANGNPSVYMPIPNRYYERVRGWSSSVLGGIAESPRFYPVTERVRQMDNHGSFTAAAGHALYTARAYPRSYWNRAAFVTEPTGHLVATFLLEPKGCDFRSRNAWNLLASNDEWSAPIMAEVGPDGQVWVIDWYNFIVQHNPTPAGYKTGKGGAYETDLRDKRHGRIYRVVHTGSPASKPMTLSKAAPEQWLAALSNDNFFWRRQAQRLLVERGQLDVLPELIRLCAEQKLDEVGLQPGVMHALWTMQGLGALEGKHPRATAAGVAALKHPAAGVRRAAVMVLPHSAETPDQIIEANLLADSDGQVRLAALLALADAPPSAPAAALLAKMWAEEKYIGDRWWMDASISAAAASDTQFLLDVAAASKTAQFGSAAQASLAIVAEHFARGGQAEHAKALITALAEANPSIATTIIAGLAKGWPKDRPVKFKSDSELVMRKLLDGLPAAQRGPLVSLAGRWQSPTLAEYVAGTTKGLFDLAAKESAPPAARIDAARQLIRLRATDAAAAEQLLALLTPKLAPELSLGFVQAVSQSEAAEVGDRLAGALRGATPNVRAAGVGVLLSRPQWTKSLVDSIESGKLGWQDISLDQRQALAVHPDSQLAARVKKLLGTGGLPNADREKVLAELMPLTKQTGDAEAGRLVFKAQCAKCHQHSGEGAKVGPDLTGMAVHPKAELLTHLIDPSRNVEGNFRVYTVVTDDGRVLTGLLASETKTTIELLDAEGKQQTLLRENIEQLTASAKSLMPEGFEKQVSRKDIVNLLEFLTRRGKFLPIPLEKVATVVSTRGMFNSEDAGGERMIFDDWSPKTFEGVPFTLVDPDGDRRPNAIVLYGPTGKLPPRMPKQVSLPCNSPVKAVHLLSGISGWGFPYGKKGSVALIVRLHYAGGGVEDHPLKNGEQFADYIRRVDVPDSKFAFLLQDGKQLRYLAVYPSKRETIDSIELVKGADDTTAPVVMAVTIEAAD